MNRKDWEAQVYKSDLNTTARCVALVIGSFGNWQDSRTVWPSTKAIADMAGMHRDTAQKYMDAFVEQGWLVVVKVRPGNIREYELQEAVAYPLGILAKGSRKSNLPNRQASAQDEDHKQLPNRQASSCLTEPEQLPNGAVPVAYPLGTNLKEPTSRNLLEQQTTHTVPDGPVVTIPSSLKERQEEAPRVKYLLNKSHRLEIESKCKTYGLSSLNEIEEVASIIENKVVEGRSFMDRLDNALTLKGVDLGDDW